MFLIENLSYKKKREKDKKISSEKLLELSDSDRQQNNETWQCFKNIHTAYEYNPSMPITLIVSHTDTLRVHQTQTSIFSLSILHSTLLCVFCTLKAEPGSYSCLDELTCPLNRSLIMKNTFNFDGQSTFSGTSLKSTFIFNSIWYAYQLQHCQGLNPYCDAFLVAF